MVSKVPKDPQRAREATLPPTVAVSAAAVTTRQQPPRAVVAPSRPLTTAVHAGVPARAQQPQPQPQPHPPKHCGLLGSAVPVCSYFSPGDGSSSIAATYGNLTCLANYTFEAAAAAVTAAGTGVGPGVGPGTATSSAPTFALVAYTGVAWFVRDLGVQMCAVIQCQNDDFGTCIPVPKVDDPGEVLAADAVFASLSVRGNFSNSESPLRFGLAADAGAQLLPPGLFLPDHNAGSFELRRSAVLNAALFVRTDPM